MNILKNSYIYLGIAAVLTVFSVLVLLIPKLNLGIDMTGGIQMEYDYTKPIDLDKLSKDLHTKKESFVEDGKQVINNINVYNITGEKTVAVVVGFYDTKDEVKLDKFKTEFKTEVFNIIKTQDSGVIETKYINIGKSFGDYIKNTGYLTLAISIVAIALYITFAFSGVTSGVSVVSFGVIIIISLIHDVLVSAGLYVFTSMFLPEFQIDTFFITALLTILGYSINDTIVVFDRIRSNLEKYAGKSGDKGKNLYDIINISVSDTMTRSIYTSLTIIFVLITVFFFGPDSISGFILVMIYGTLIGTYSSIFVASPILYMVNKDKKLSVYKKVIINPEDKIVV